MAHVKIIILKIKVFQKMKNTNAFKNDKGVD